jgi:hypothetical protein
LEKVKMETDATFPQENQHETATNDIDWDNRVLCSDGNCIGVVGTDGRCKECGKKYEGDDPPKMSSAENEDQSVAEEDLPSETAANDEPEAAPASETEAAPVDQTDAAPTDDEWENRVLCSDGNCIGIIGADGKCKECGKSSE